MTSTESEATTDTGMKSADSGPAGEPVVVEYLVRARSTWGTRIHADGAVDEWSDAAGWRPLVSVPADELAAFLGLARDGGFRDLPATLEPDPPVDDATELAWSIDLGGERHDVVAREASHARNPVLVTLDRELQLLVGRALARRADAEDEGDDEGDEAGEGDEPGDAPG